MIDIKTMLNHETAVSRMRTEPYMFDYERLLYYMYSVLNAGKWCRYPYIRANDDIKIINMGILTRPVEITSAIALLKRKRFIEASKIISTSLKAYYLTDEGISFCERMFNKSSTEQPKKTEEEQPKRNEDDYSNVKKTKNYKILFVKLMDMIIETPEFKNDVSLIIRILTDLKNDGWFIETPDGQYPISDDAVKGYTRYMNEEGRKIIDKEVSKPNKTQQLKQNTINTSMSYNDLMQLYAKLMGIAV